MTSRRGSYKTPGGKLVNVDFDVDDGVLSDVTVHGDFFLQPDDALQAIMKSLDAAPANLSAAEFFSAHRGCAARAQGGLARHLRRSRKPWCEIWRLRLMRLRQAAAAGVS
ncbi:MAG: hypothetical protein R2839_04530 [Thermomicrobiales bacterium]